MNSRMDWYFDFISPFAFLQWHKLRRDAAHITLTPHPLLFAGLLSHWDNKGPVEIPPKRGWTYAHCLWIAKREGIPMCLPSSHPFNPLPLLRLSLAAGATPDVVDRLFRFVWQDGLLPTDQFAWQALLQEFSLDDAALSSPEVKTALRRNGEQAISLGVFGVPTAIVDKRAFWGVDATDMLLAYVANDSFFTSDEYHRAYALPVGTARK
ncbi:MAG: 2-hydroxychromene-2-carboxylate isomerase [bacterium]